MSSHETDIILGETYRDTLTGVEGVATSVAFYLHACERVGLESWSPTAGELQEFTFDAPRLVHVSTGQQATTDKTGGPARPVPRPRSLAR